MLTILNDPAGITGRQRHELDVSITLQANIERHLAGGGDCELLINGIKVDPLKDARLDALPSRFDQVTVVRRPAGVETWILVASLLLSVYSIATAPRPEDAPLKNDGPNNKLTGQTNIARAYQAVPDVFGLRRVWPDLIQPTVVEYRNHIKYLTEWLCVSRGTGVITDVQFAETPLDDPASDEGVDGAEWEAFYPDYVGPILPGSPLNYPENQTTTLTDVVETFACADVNGQELTASQPYQVVSMGGTITVGSPTTNLTAVFTDGAQWAQIKAASLPLTCSFRFQRAGGAAFNDSRTGTITSVSTGGGNITLGLTVNAALTGSPINPCLTTISPSGTASFNKIGAFVLPLSDATKIRWNTIFERGLKGSVSVKAEWWQVDASGAEISGTREATATGEHPTYTADTFDARYFTTEVTPAAGAGRYKIEFTRQTAAAADGSDVAKLEAVFAVRTFATKVLPGVTVIKVTTKATERATGARERKFNLRFARHVRTLSTDPIEAADITASRNFARILAHVWCVAGGNLAELDTDTLAALNTQHGETSPLLRFDGTLDDADMSLGQRLQLIADTARCKVWRDGTRWTVTREQAQTTPVVQFDYRNLAAGGESQIVVDAFMPASHDGVEIEYTDEDTQSTRAYARRVITGGTVSTGDPLNPLRIRLVGCATEAQAENRADLEARRLLYQRTKVTDSALADGGLVGLGQLVRWIDPNDFAGDDGLQAGEVLAIDGDVITCSEPLDWKGETSGRTHFTGIDGAPLGAPVVVTPVSGQPYQATLASVPGGLYVADGVNSQLGSRYAFGVGFTESEMEAAGLYVVERATPGANRTASIALLNYDERLYEED